MYQIGNAFTRLAPSITFFECLPQVITLHATDSTVDNSADNDGSIHASSPASQDLSAADTTCVLGNPPKKFATVHASALINAWHAKLQQCLADPVQLEQRKGHRRVGVLGTAIFDFAPDGLLTVYAWDFGEDDRVKLVKLPAQAAAIQGTPYQSLWMAGFELGALRAILQRLPGQATLCRAYVAWAQAKLAARLWTTEVQESVRYQVAIALDLDIWAIGVASQIQLTTQPKRPMRPHAYNHAITYRQGFETLQQEAPQLIALYALMAQEIKNIAEPYQATEMMALLLKAHGIKPATWRLLCRVGTDWMKEFLAYYDFERDSPVGIATDLLTIVQAFGTDHLVPPWLLHAFIQLGGNPNAPSSNYTKRLGDMFPLCKRLGHLLAQADDATVALLKDRALAICAWASDHLANTPKGYVRRATLGGLLRRVDLQIKRDEFRQKHQRGWKSPYKLTLQNMDLEAVILDSPLAIWSEGQTMHHCAANLIQTCARGHCLMISLRSPVKSRPLATVTFDMRGLQITPHKMSGFANTLVSPEVRDIAQDCCRQLQLQRHRIRRQHAVTLGSTQSKESEVHQPDGQ
jgi:hypothetical protein